MRGHPTRFLQVLIPPSEGFQGAARVPCCAVPGELPWHLDQPPLKRGGVGDDRRRPATLPGASLWTQQQDEGITGFTVKTPCLLFDCDRELGACMNHNYLHATNVWTKGLEGLSWEHFFSHEKRCFGLQGLLDYVSCVANLKSQCPLRITLSRPEDSVGVRNKDQGCAPSRKMHPVRHTRKQVPAVICPGLHRVSTVSSVELESLQRLLPRKVMMPKVCLLSGRTHCITCPASCTKVGLGSDRWSNRPRDTQL